MEYKKALVTGGAGFIGSHIVDQLLKKGIETYVLDNFSTGKKNYVSPQATLIKEDIRDLNLLNKVCKGIDILFHNAACVSVRHAVEHFYEDAETNILGTINVIKAIIKNKIKKIVYASSMAVYGEAKVLPIKENHILQPLSPYGISKLSGEYYCLLMGKLYHFEAVSLRYFNTYGIRQTLTPYVGVITIFINRLLKKLPPIIFGNGEQFRDFVSVKDVAEANMQAMEKGRGGLILNIGSGKSMNITKLARLCTKKIQPEIKTIYHPKQKGEVRNSIADITRAKKYIGYTPKYQLERELDEIIEWNRKQQKIFWI